MKNRDVPVEARGQQPTTHKNEGANTRVTGALQVTLEDDTTSGTDKAKERVEQLRQELRQTELDMSLAKATATTNESIVTILWQVMKVPDQQWVPP